MKTLKIVIKRDDFLRSDGYMNSTNCPLARALKSKFPNEEISVGGKDVDIGEEVWNIKDFDNVIYILGNEKAKMLKRNSIINNVILYQN